MVFYITAIILGLCLSAMAMGIFITMKIFKIPDITTDGSYTLGAVITALLLTQHLPAYIIIPCVMLAGAAAGSCTGLIHTKLEIDALLSGILVMTGLYSINLLLLGRSNVPLLDITSIFSFIHIFSNPVLNDAITGGCFIAVIALILAYVLKTDFGIAMRATGSNASMVRALGINNNLMKITGLALANSLTALSGYLVAQYQNFTDINMGIGIVITGLGSVLIGDTIIKWWNIRSIGLQLTVILAGSIIFQLVLAFTLAIGVNPNLLKLVTAVIVLLIVSIPKWRAGRGRMITVENIHKVYNKHTANEVVALKNVSLQIDKNQYVVIVGANGSGKTTLLNIIAGAEKCTTGSIRFNDEDVTNLPDFQRSRWVARVFQNPLMGTAADLSILDNFRLAAIRTGNKRLRIGVNAAFRKTVRDKIASLNMGLENKVEQNMGTLSGGQRQALTLLMSVMDHTEILLLDEPTAALDPRSAATVLQLANSLIEQYHLTAILITHSLKDAHQHGNRLIQMNEGTVLRDLDVQQKASIKPEELFKWFE